MVYVRKNRKKKNRKIFVITAVTLALLLIAATVINKKLDPLVCDIAEPQIRAAISETVSRAVNEALTTGEYAGAVFVKTETGGDGRIISVHADTALINRFKNDIVIRINSILAGMREYYVYISLSNLFDDELFWARFPTLEMSAGVLPVGGADCNIESGLFTAGVNQTHYKIMFRIKTLVNAQMLISTMRIESETEICVSETVIVGEVPLVYSHGLN